MLWCQDDSHRRTGNRPNHRWSEEARPDRLLTVQLQACTILARRGCHRLPSVSRRRRQLDRAHESTPTARWVCSRTAVQTTEMIAAILAAGQRTRMQPFTSRYPKPLPLIGNKPLLRHHSRPRLSSPDATRGEDRPGRRVLLQLETGEQRVGWLLIDAQPR